MKLVDWMKSTFEPYGSTKLWVVVMPLPPLNVRGIIYMPDSYASKVFDSDYTIETTGIDFKIITTSPSRWGPAILVRTELSQLLYYDSDGYLSVNAKSCCASVSYALKSGIKVKPDGPSLDAACDVTIDRLNFSGSCNPGSHIVVPGAPYLTAVLQFAAAPNNDFIMSQNGILTRTPFLDPWEAFNLFPNINLNNNKHVDEYIKCCAVASRIRLRSDLTSLGDWAVPYLREMRVNSLFLENDYGSERLCIPVDQSKENGGTTGAGPI